MQQINQIINKAIQPAAESESRAPRKEYGTFSQKVISFFDHLSDIFGSKFDHAFKSQDAEEAAKNAYQYAIDGIDGQTLGEGLKRLVIERTKGNFLWLEIAEVIGFIQGTIGNVEQIKIAYREFLNGGVPINKQSYSKLLGREVIEKVGMTWTTGIMLECSKRLQSPAFLASPEAEFNSVFLQVLQEERMGKVYELPKQLEHKESNTKTDEDRRNDRARIEKSKGCKDFFAQFKKGVS